MLTVGGLTDYIQFLLEDDERLHRVWVTGEVSSAKPFASGLYFTLRDPEQKAAIDCVVWRGQVPRLAADPEPGEQVLVLGDIRLYAARGRYQLVVWQVLPGGEGLQALRYRQLRDRLRAEGLFDESQKRPLPVHPQTVAAITSPQAAAWGDIQRTLQQRYPGLHVLFSPAIVQGERAPESLVAALERVVRDGRAEVAIVARGGGATEDLSCFDDERLVRAIAACPIPIVSGIGHQRDESLADLVADACAHTPTAAAELAVPRWQDLYDHHRARVAILRRAVEEALAREDDRLQMLHYRLQSQRPDRQLQQERSRLRWLRQHLLRAIDRRLQAADHRQQLLAQKLDGLSPERVLQRGYAVARQSDGAIVRDAAAVSPDEILSLQLGRGRLRVQVLAAEPDGEGDPNGMPAATPPDAGAASPPEQRTALPNKNRKASPQASPKAPPQKNPRDRP